jgi:hypothetical protein
VLKRRNQTRPNVQQHGSFSLWFRGFATVLYAEFDQPATTALSLCLRTPSSSCASFRDPGTDGAKST